MYLENSGNPTQADISQDESSINFVGSKLQNQEKTGKPKTTATSPRFMETTHKFSIGSPRYPLESFGIDMVRYLLKYKPVFTHNRFKINHFN